MKTSLKTPRRMRWWIPIALLLFWGGAVFSLRHFEVIFSEQATLAVTLLTALLMAFWYILLTGLPGKTRALLLGSLVLVLAGLGFGISRWTRVDGSIGGSGVPRLVWKWTPPRDSRLEELTVPAPVPADAHLEPSSSAADWPQFLGPERTGAAVSSPPLARDWESEPPREIWRRPVGLGWSSFAVVGERAVTQEQRGPHELTVCYERLTGRILWAQTNEVRFSEALGGDGPRSTPTVDKGRVFAFGATGILDCLDLASGKRIWTVDVLREAQAGNVTWGKSASPLVYGERVIVTGGEGGRGTLLAFDAATGGLVWAAGEDAASYASPVSGRLAGREQILITNARSAAGHDPKDGTILWEYPWPGDFPKVTQPLAAGEDRVLIAAGYGIGTALLELKPGPGGKLAVNELWRNRSLKPKFTNPVIREGFVYGLDDGILACVDLETGERRWKEGRYGHGQVLLAGDLLLIQAESGAVVLVEANPSERRELTRFKPLSEKTWNYPALSGEYLFVRNDQEAACYRLPVIGAEQR